jgi:hypothetical protein
MKPLLLALVIPSIFVGCTSNEKTNKELGGPASTVMVADSMEVAPLPKGAKRVVVQTRSADGSSTITTTTTQGSDAVPVTKGSPVATVQNASKEPVTVPAPAATEEKKKGWSTRAKGAAIGGVAGAATGAIISKNKVGGAILGGAVGAGGGYIIGNEIDRNKKQPQ